MKIGDTVSKISEKPFKSSKKEEVIIGFVVNPYSKKLAAVFDDNSFCDISQLKILKK